MFGDLPRKAATVWKTITTFDKAELEHSDGLRLVRAGIPEEEVILTWLEMVVGRAFQPYQFRSKRALKHCLYQHQSGPTFIFDSFDLQWQLVELDPDVLGELQLVKGPPDEGWRRVIPESDATTHTLDTVARRIRRSDRDEFPPVIRERLEKVDALSECYRNGDQLPPLVLIKENHASRLWIADGNHRALAAYLCLLADGTYRSQEAYLGTGTVSPSGWITGQLLYRMARLRSSVPDPHDVVGYPTESESK